MFHRLCTIVSGLALVAVGCGGNGTSGYFPTVDSGYTANDYVTAQGDTGIGSYSYYGDAAASGYDNTQNYLDAGTTDYNTTSDDAAVGNSSGLLDDLVGDGFDSNTGSTTECQLDQVCNLLNQGSASGRPCQTNRVCDPGEYCHHDTPGQGEIGCGITTTGICKKRPCGCDKGERGQVCGCNGRTYESEFYAQAAGTSVRRKGACPAICWSNAQCPANAFCQFGIDCGAVLSGFCATKPTVCPTTGTKQTCTCASATYNSACEAAKKGLTTYTYGAEDGQCGGRESCDRINETYKAKLEAAKKCQVDSTGQCNKKWPNDLYCGCDTFVAGGTANLDALMKAFNHLQCGQYAPTQCNTTCPTLDLLYCDCNKSAAGDGFCAQ